MSLGGRGGSTELEVKIVACKFFEKHKYFVKVQVDQPAPVSAPADPGMKKARTTHKTTILNYLKTEDSILTTQPTFENNAFAFRVPSIIQNDQSETLLFSLRFDVYKIISKNDHFSKHRPKSRSMDVGPTSSTRQPVHVGAGMFHSDADTSQRLLHKKSLLHTVYIHEVFSVLEEDETDINLLSIDKNQGVYGTVDIAIELNLSSNRARSDISFEEKPIRRKEREFKLTQLVGELKATTGLHLRLMEEQRQQSGLDFKEYMKEVQQEMGLKRGLLQRLLGELRQKGEALKLYKQAIMEERERIDELETTCNNKDLEVKRMRRKMREMEDHSLLYSKLQKIRKQNILYENKLRRMKELEHAHQSQAKVMLKNQNRIKRYKNYRKLAKKQEVIIRKLEAVLRSTYQNQEIQKKRERKKMREKEKRGGEQQKEDELGSLSKFKGAIEDRDRQIINLEDELKVKNDRIQTLEEEMEIKDDKIQQLKTEIHLTVKKCAKEMQVLRMALAKNKVPIERINDTKFDEDSVFNRSSDRRHRFVPSPRIGSGRRNFFRSRVDSAGSINSSVSQREIFSRHPRRRVPSTGKTDMLSIPPSDSQFDNEVLPSEFDEISLPPLSRGSSLYRFGGNRD